MAEKNLVEECPTDAKSTYVYRSNQCDKHFVARTCRANVYCGTFRPFEEYLLLCNIQNIGQFLEQYLADERCWIRSGGIWGKRESRNIYLRAWGVILNPRTTSPIFILNLHKQDTFSPLFSGFEGRPTQSPAEASILFGLQESIRVM